MSIDAHEEEAANERPGAGRRRVAFFLIAVLAFLLLAFVPPLVNVGRLQRHVDAEISAALGRPVHFDHLSLNLLPMPGFTLDNFVIEEDPAFGYEPTLHADEVRINLRLRSLWRRRLEFSSISFTAPSVNVVHRPDGRWNLQGLLLQASRIPAAPTAQTHPGPTLRFPYIEATGARVNLKLGQEKTPVALTEADFALWQPVEHQWHFRIEAHPVRSDIAPGENGVLRAEGTLGGDRAHSTLADMPMDLQLAWQDAQLGGLTSLLLGRDAGLRGDLAATATATGTLGQNSIIATLNAENARRADFIPQRPLSVTVTCSATAENSFHAFRSIECRMPQGNSPSSAMLALAASVPDVRRPDLASVRIDVPSMPSQTLYDWLGVATPHPPTAFAGRGRLTGALEWGHTMQNAETSAATQALSPQWTGELKLSGEWLKLTALGDDGAPLGDVILSSVPAVMPSPRPARKVQPEFQSSHDHFELAPITLPLGGAYPAILTGGLDDTGYSLHLAGSLSLDQLFALGDAIPQFGDGLRRAFAGKEGTAADNRNAESAASVTTTRGHRIEEPQKPTPSEPVAVDLLASRKWGGAQVWLQASPQFSVHDPIAHRRR